MRPIDLRELLQKRLLVFDNPWGEIVRERAELAKEAGEGAESLAEEETAEATAGHAAGSQKRDEEERSSGGANDEERPTSEHDSADEAMDDDRGRDADEDADEEDEDERDDDEEDEDEDHDEDDDEDDDEDEDEDEDHDEDDDEDEDEEDDEDDDEDEDEDDDDDEDEAKDAEDDGADDDSEREGDDDEQGKRGKKRGKDAGKAVAKKPAKRSPKARGRAKAGHGGQAEAVRKPPEWIAIEDPDTVTRLFSESLEEGVDVLLTGTLAATAPALQPFGLEDEAGPIMRAWVSLARKAVDERGRREDGTPLVGAVIGPLPLGVAPEGALSLNVAVAAYREAAKAAKEAGADLFVLDAFEDLGNLKAALIGVRESNAGLPVVALFAFEQGGRAASGLTPAVAWAVARSLGADAIGATGALSPSQMIPILAAFQAVSDLPLVFLPAAQPRDGGRKASLAPTAFAREVTSLLERGIAGVGCAGVRMRAHVARLVKAARGHRPQVPELSQRLVVTSASRDVEIGARRGIVCAAEWPALRGETFRAHRGGSGHEHLLALLSEQAAAEVHMLEIRSTLPHADEPSFFANLIPGMQGRIDLPLLISADTVKGLKTALELAPGRALVSGVWGDERSYEQIFPLARRHGAAVVAACHTGAKIPENAAERVTVAEKILAAAIDAGLRQEDVIFDPVIMPAQGKSGAPGEDALQAMKEIEERLGAPTMLRVSRASEGLPARGQIEAAFLAMAASAGLDLAVIDAAKPRLVHLAMAASLLTGRDPGGRRFAARFRMEETRTGAREPRRSESSARRPGMQREREKGRDYRLPPREAGERRSREEERFEREGAAHFEREGADRFGRERTDRSGRERPRREQPFREARDREFVPRGRGGREDRDRWEGRESERRFERGDRRDKDSFRRERGGRPHGGERGGAFGRERGDEDRGRTLWKPPRRGERGHRGALSSRRPGEWLPWREERERMRQGSARRKPDRNEETRGGRFGREQTGHARERFPHDRRSREDQADFGLGREPRERDERHPRKRDEQTPRRRAAHEPRGREERPPKPLRSREAREPHGTREGRGPREALGPREKPPMAEEDSRDARKRRRPTSPKAGGRDRRSRRKG
ncbi:MAG: homocysteine S-methyltransferase family protein [Candidatus Eisenbacteria bacterium]|nr:homocysteine S-methyltransferase family protein [Candidatus Eisenbacteria bacterium]